MGLSRVPITVDRLVGPEQALHRCALHAFSSAVDQPDDLESRVLRGAEILVHDRDDIAWIERVQVDGVLDGDVDGSVFHGVLKPIADS